MKYIEDFDNYNINEGIDVENHIITLTDKHNKGVDFRIEINPIVSKVKVNDYDIDIVSIFKRTQLIIKEGGNDGNPLIYALKDINGYELKITENEFKLYLRKFLIIFDKYFSNDHINDTIILSASKK